jgi:hypothetical protein
MPIFKLDRTAFKAHNAADSSNHSLYYRNMSWQQRLSIADYLNSVAFNYALDNPPKMDRTKFKARSRNSNG